VALKEQIVVRLPAELLERVDAVQQQMQESASFTRVTRSDAVRALLEEALNQRGAARTQEEELG